MDKETFEHVISYLEDDHIGDMYGERMEAILTALSKYMKDATPEQEQQIKERIMEVKDIFLEGDWGYIESIRKSFKIPKSHYWWYMDKL